MQIKVENNATMGSTSSTGGGYTCTGCGTWVPSYLAHTCYGRAYPSSPPPQIIYTNPPMNLAPIIEAIRLLTEKLNELAKEVEKLVANQQ